MPSRPLVALVALVTLIVGAWASDALATRSPHAAAVTGSYHSNWDDVKLVQEGDRVYGTYVCCQGGTIEGRIIEGRVLHYVWRQPGGWGHGVWTIDGDHLEGTWGWNRSETDGGRWDLARIGRRNQIAN